MVVNEVGLAAVLVYVILVPLRAVVLYLLICRTLQATHEWLYKS